MRTSSRELLAVGIFGGKSRGFESNLGDRIEMLLRHGRTFSPRASAIGVATSAVVLGALCCWPLRLPRAGSRSRNNRHGPHSKWLPSNRGTTSINELGYIYCPAGGLPRPMPP
jgi:hypothetical protein